MIVPKVHPVMKFGDALEYARSLDLVLIPYERAKGMRYTKELFASIRPGQSVGIFIGPEGGFEQAEVEQAVENGSCAGYTGKEDSENGNGGNDGTLDSDVSDGGRLKWKYIWTIRRQHGHTRRLPGW